ncbi:hypothetical protein [Pseudomonas bohemica]|uniref:hypothetical protein n=1 Tax=Pseudomonas bohemica TaxID=2044872 RepID=UPI000DA61865|nr:hypothetical protein [Pseudomonas bohemica]
MKMPILGTLAAVTIALSGATFAADSDTQENVSGASDSTVMTQTQGTTIEKKQHKQNQADENKRGRPANKTAPASN